MSDLLAASKQAAVTVPPTTSNSRCKVFERPNAKNTLEITPGLGCRRLLRSPPAWAHPALLRPAAPTMSLLITATCIVLLMNGTV